MKKKKLLLASAFVILFISLASVTLYQLYLRYYKVSYTANASSATADSLHNPYQGWYHIYSYLLKDDAPLDTELIQEQLEESADTELVMIQINLRHFSDRYLGASALSQLDELFTIWEAEGKQLIIRFLYDWDGNAAQTEPESIAIIQDHMLQTSSIINQHKQSIYLLQGIYVGDYGEMHDSVYMSQASMCQLAQTLHSCIDPSIYLAVRTPAQWRSITGNTAPLTEETAFLEDNIASRMGLFNDGMMGSESDLGTYLEPTESPEDSKEKGTRSEEMSFQNQLCQYVPNGGEVVYDTVYNDFTNAILAMETMHISYLDIDYDLTPLDKWRSATYEGPGCFHGSNGLSYVGEHLGYRYEIASSDCSYHTLEENLTLQLSIKNSGFASCYRPLKASMILINKEQNRRLEYPIDTDARFWACGQTTDLLLPVPVTDPGAGTCKVYFSLTDETTKRPIELATTLPLTEDGYCLGTLQITK